MADGESDEEPLEDASIEEVGEEGDFLEDFPDDTEVRSAQPPLAPSLTPHEGPGTRSCPHWVVGEHAAAPVRRPPEADVSPPELHLAPRSRGVPSSDEPRGARFLR